MIFLATFVSHVLPFIYIGFLALFFWAFTRYKAFGRNSSLGISEKVWDSAHDLYKDKEFVKDFVNILQKESNLSDIVNKSITQYYKEDQTYKGVVQRRATEDMRDWDVLIKGNIKGEGFDLDAKRIAIEVMKSNGYKKFSKKYNEKLSEKVTDENWKARTIEGAWFRSNNRFMDKNYSGALQDISVVLKYEPNNSKAILRIAECRQNLKDFNGAITDYSKYLEIQIINYPKSFGVSAAYLGRGQCKYNLE
jgi:tetratricopeptide (TPR) repeat protein